MNTITNYEALLAISRIPELSQPVRDYLVALLAEHREMYALLEEHLGDWVLRIGAETDMTRRTRAILRKAAR